MINPANVAVTQAAERLLVQYGFDLDGLSRDDFFQAWVEMYPPRWIRLAVIEALYQGRYKAISVEQLLAFWLRRGEAQTHFNSEFEAIICRNLPRDLNAVDSDQASDSQSPANSGTLPETKTKLYNTPSPTPTPGLDRKTVVGTNTAAANINQFQPQTELTTQFTEKLSAIAQAWKASQTSLSSASLLSHAPSPISTLTTPPQAPTTPPDLTQ